MLGEFHPEGDNIFIFYLLPHPCQPLLWKRARRDSQVGEVDNHASETNIKYTETHVCLEVTECIQTQARGRHLAHTLGEALLYILVRERRTNDFKTFSVFSFFKSML